MDRATKHGLADLVTADAFSFNQAELFATLQRLTLMHRLNDSYTCLVSTFLVKHIAENSCVGHVLLCHLL